MVAAAERAEQQADLPGAGDGLVAAARPCKVMVVDDHRDSADSLAILLQMQGYAVMKAYDAHAALRVAELHVPDLVFLDLGLPDVSGYEVARALRAKFPGRKPVLIATTAWGSLEDRRRTQEAGFAWHLLKPYGFEEVLDVLSRFRR